MSIPHSGLYFTENLNTLLSVKNLTQKELAAEAGVTPSTLSGYMRGDKYPNIEFLQTIKNHLSGVSMDDFLFTPLRKEDFISDISYEANMPLTNLAKYYGGYYMYYRDTNRSSTGSSAPIDGSDLRYGVMYIYKSLQSDFSADCISVFGIKRRDEALQAMKLIQAADNDPTLIVSKLKEKHPHNVYTGKLDKKGDHIYIISKQKSDKFDETHIILNHYDSNKDYYTGGLGTMNSTSTGTPSDPITQFIGFSKEFVYLSDDEIKEYLRFIPPALTIETSAESLEIMKLASELYDKSSNSPYGALSFDNKKVLLNSYMNELMKRHLEANHLWYGRITSAADKSWYIAVKNSKAHAMSIKENLYD